MKRSESMKTFIAMCAEHGFSRRGKMFCRCIGDGIFQKISVACQDYMSPSSPEYSAAQRKSPCVQFCFWSMYSSIPEPYFDDPRAMGAFFPENLLGERFRTDIFMGLPSQVQIMEEKGFPLLDSITTQKRLVEESRRLYIVDLGHDRHQFTLGAPMMLCGEESAAIDQLYGLYGREWRNFHHCCDHLKSEGKIDEYLAEEHDCEMRIKEIYEFLWMATMGEKEKLRMYFWRICGRTRSWRKRTKFASERTIGRCWRRCKSKSKTPERERVMCPLSKRQRKNENILLGIPPCCAAGGIFYRKSSWRNGGFVV